MGKWVEVDRLEFDFVTLNSDWVKGSEVYLTLTDVWIRKNDYKSMAFIKLDYTIKHYLWKE